MLRSQIALFTLAIFLASCSEFVEEDECLNEVHLAPLGYSEITIDVAKYEGLSQEDIIFVSRICSASRPIGIIAFETESEIKAWLELKGEPLDKSRIYATANFWIFKYGDGDREFFVTHFKTDEIMR